MLKTAFAVLRLCCAAFQGFDESHTLNTPQLIADLKLIAHATGINKLKRYEREDLFDCRSDIRELVETGEAYDRLDNIVSLSLLCGKKVKLPAEAIRLMKNLKELEMSKVRITEDELDMLARRIEKLTLRDTQLSVETFRRLLEMGKLTRITLRKCALFLGSEAEKFSFSDEICERIVAVDFPEMIFQGNCLEWLFLELLKLKKLKFLNLDGANIGGLLRKHNVEISKVWGSLMGLSLRGCGLDYVGFREIRELRSLVAVILANNSLCNAEDVTDGHKGAGRPGNQKGGADRKKGVNEGDQCSANKSEQCSAGDQCGAGDQRGAGEGDQRRSGKDDQRSSGKDDQRSSGKDDQRSSGKDDQRSEDSSDTEEHTDAIQIKTEPDQLPPKWNFNALRHTLKYINVDNCNLPQEFLIGLSECTKLVHVNISNNIGLGEVFAQSRLNLHHLRMSVSDLILNNVGLTFIGFERICSFMSLKNLSACSNRGLGGRAIPSSFRFGSLKTTLRKIRLNGIAFGKSGIDAINALKSGRLYGLSVCYDEV